MIYNKELFYNEYMIEIMLYFALINCERLRLLEIYVVTLNWQMICPEFEYGESSLRYIITNGVCISPLLLANI